MSLNNQGRKKSGGGGGDNSNIGGGSQRSFASGGPHNNRSHFSGGGGGRGRGGAAAATSTNNSNPSPSLSSNRSFKKNDNAQGGRGRGNAVPVNAAESSAASGARSVENGAHVQSTSQGVSKTPTSAAVPKIAETTDQKGIRPPPKAPSSQSSSLTPDSTAPATPTKGDGAKGFSLQFGSISPGFMNGMQVPPRTSSAPPNLDEQKRAQALRDAARVVPAVPVPAVPKPELPKKDVAPTQQSTDVHMESKPKRDAPLASGPPTTQAVQAQKPSPLPIPGIAMSLPYHQQTVPIQYGGPTQIQSQGVPTSSLQMPMQMPLQMGNPAQVPQQVFMPGLQHHLMQTQGIMHQAQNLGFSPQLAPQIPHHVGNMGMNMSPQYNQQQGGNFGSARKTTVKITHPETHEELRLDNRDGGSSRLKSHPSAPQSQPAQTYAPTPSAGYYGSSYTAAPPFFQGQNSVSLTSSQLSSGSQGPRFSYPVSQTPSTVSLANQSGSNTSSVSKGGASSHGSFDASTPDNVRDSHKVLPSARSGSTTVTIKAAGSSAEEKVAESVSVAKALPQKSPNQASDVSAVRKDFEVNANSSSPKSAASITVAVSVSEPARSTPIPAGSTGELSSNLSHIDGRKGELVSKSTLTNVKEPGKKAHSHPLEQASVHNSAIVLPNLSDSSKVVSSESGEAKPTQASSGLKEVASEAVQPSSTTAVAALSDVSGVIPRVESTIKPYESLSSDDSVKTNKVVETDDGESIRIDAAEAELGLSQRDAESDTSSAKRDKILVQTPPLEIGLQTLSNGSNISASNPTVIGMVDSLSAKELNASNPNMPDNEATILAADCSEAIAEHESEIMESSRPSSSSGLDRSAVEPSKSKNNKGKKKWKEMLQKADAQGTTSDLYMAYKGREETTEVIAADGSSVSSPNDFSADAKSEEHTRKNEDGQDKPELDDWEDAADISTPKLESLGDGDGANSPHDEEGVSMRKYSRDFLLTCADQCKDLPDGFEITPDMAGALLRVDVTASRGDREHPSPGRIVDRSPGAARVDRRGNPIMDPERWSKLPGPFPQGRERGPDLGHAMGARGGPGPNHGVLGHPRPQGPVPHGGGLLSTHYPVMPSDGAGRWLRGSQFQKGLIPPPQTPLQMMHKAENKFEVGKVSDEEAAKQKRVKGILNKLTPQNFEKLFEQVKQINIDNAATLTGVIDQIFDKALTEPTFCEMYANFCFHLAADLPDLSVDNEKLTFKRLLLNKCQVEFERGEREEEEANKADDEGETKQSDEEREEKRLKSRRRMLGNIRLIGELYKKRMLTERIMHECIKKLLGQYHNPDEENIEALCKLMSTIGEMIDHPKAKEHMDAYFDIMRQLSNNMKLSSRLRFMLRDSIDLRKNKWQERRKVEGPKKIDEVHRDAAQEKKEQAQQGNWLNRAPSMNTGMRRAPPSEYGHRGPMMSSPVGQVGGYRGMPSMGRGFGMQDARVNERSVYESRTLSMPLPQRSSGDEVITLGPQGGLARGMAFSGQPSGSSSPVLDISSSYGDPRRTVGSFNGYSNTSERGVYSSREDHFARQLPERFAGPTVHDNSSSQELNAGYTNRDFRHLDRSSDRSGPVTPPMVHAGVSRGPNVFTETVWPEEKLHEKSIAAIKEYYSCNDVKELALCIQDLNAPSLNPTIVSMWVTDSFERKDKERDLLAKLLVNLTKPHEGMFSSSQLIQGFESVLTNLEDTVNDAPKAPEFLGRMFGKFVLENVIPLNEVGRLIYEGGEERGSLRNAGLAGDVLGNILEMIKTEKGESVLNDIRASSMLRLEDFRPPHPMTSRKLEMFM